MIQRFINDLKKLLSGRDVRFPVGVVDTSYGSDSPDSIYLTVFGEPVEISDGDIGELTTLCYSKGSHIRELYEILDNDFVSWLFGYKNESLYLSTNFKDILSIEWYGSNWITTYDEDILKVCGISLDGADDFSDLDLFWYIIEKIDVEVLKICDILCSIYGMGAILYNCGFVIEKVPDGYRVHADPNSLLRASVIFDGDGIIVKDSKEMELMKEMYSL